MWEGMGDIGQGAGSSTARWQTGGKGEERGQQRQGGRRLLQEGGAGRGDPAGGQLLGGLRGLTRDDLTGPATRSRTSARLLHPQCRLLLLLLLLLLELLQLCAQCRGGAGVVRLQLIKVCVGLLQVSRQAGCTLLCGIARTHHHLLACCGLVQLGLQALDLRGRSRVNAWIEKDQVTGSASRLLTCTQDCKVWIAIHT